MSRQFLFNNVHPRAITNEQAEIFYPRSQKLELYRKLQHIVETMPETLSSAWFMTVPKNDTTKMILFAEQRRQLLEQFNEMYVEPRLEAEFWDRLHKIEKVFGPFYSSEQIETTINDHFNLDNDDAEELIEELRNRHL